MEHNSPKFEITCVKYKKANNVILLMIALLFWNVNGVFWGKEAGIWYINKIFVNIGFASVRCEKLSKPSEKRLSSLLLKREKKTLSSALFFFFWSATSSSDLALGSNGHGSSETWREAARYCDLSSTNHRSPVFPRLRVFIFTPLLSCPNVFICASD